MQWLKKIVLIIAVLFLLSVTGLGLYAWIRQDKLTTALVKKVNEAVNTKISYGTLKVTIFESFPNITVRFSDILVSPSPYYDRTQFKSGDNDTLLYASSLSLSAFLPSLFTGTVAVRSITVRDGQLTLLTDKRGDINYKVFNTEKKSGRNVKLNSITVRQIHILWNDRHSEIKLSGNISEAALGGEIFKAGIYLHTALAAEVDSFSVSGIVFGSVPINADVRLRKSNNSLSVTKGSLELADLRFDIDGIVNYSNKHVDMSVDGRKISIASVISLLPEKYRLLTDKFRPSGILDLKCTITGSYGEAGKPHLDLTYNLTGGKMSSLATGFKVNNLMFRGGLTNGALNNRETFQCTVDDLSAGYGSASLTGSFMLNSLVRPHITLVLDGDLNFDDLHKIINSDIIHDQSGSVRGSLRLSGFLPDSTRLQLSSLLLLNPEASLSFSDFSADFASSGVAIKNVNGSLHIMNDLVAEDFSFLLMDQYFEVTATMRNFTSWLAGRPETLNITGDVSTDRFVTAAFTGSENDSTSSKKKTLNIFPADVTAHLGLKADSLVSKGFRAAHFSSTLDYKPFVIIFRDIKAEALDGLLTGEFMIGKQEDGGYISKSTLDVKDIDINKTFSSFNNFGQSFIVTDNLAGTLTGSVTLLTPLDSSYKIITKAVVAEAHLLISEGRLVSFAPAESLSSYLDLDELRDIKFSKMENDLFINNRTVSVPKMLVNSSAVNFTVYGTHTFDNNYSYHVRLLLSEVLSRKARERNRDLSALEQIKVDGSGKATIPLKLVCENGVTSVGYDFGQAEDNIKTDIVAEKKTLKGILNEEYGWYKTDTIKTRPAETRPKFTITWDEGKDTSARKEPSDNDVKESPLKIKLKKKR
jgi:hypothetical protein